MQKAAASYQTYQLISSVDEDVEGVDTVGAVFPLAVHHHTGLLVHPGKEVVGVTVVHRVGGRGGGGGGGGVIVQLVAIVTWEEGGDGVRRGAVLMLCNPDIPHSTKFSRHVFSISDRKN